MACSPAPLARPVALRLPQFKPHLPLVPLASAMGPRPQGWGPPVPALAPKQPAPLPRPVAVALPPLEEDVMVSSEGEDDRPGWVANVIGRRFFSPCPTHHNVQRSEVRGQLGRVH